MKKLFIASFLLSAFSANAMVTVYSSAKIRSGIIDGISVRADLKEVNVLIKCNNDKTLIKYTKENFEEGLKLSGSIDRFYSISMSRSLNANLVSVDEYQIVKKQEALPGEVVCAAAE